MKAVALVGAVVAALTIAVAVLAVMVRRLHGHQAELDARMHQLGLVKEMIDDARTEPERRRRTGRHLRGLKIVALVAAGVELARRYPAPALAGLVAAATVTGVALLGSGGHDGGRDEKDAETLPVPARAAPALTRPIETGIPAETDGRRSGSDGAGPVGAVVPAEPGSDEQDMADVEPGPPHEPEADPALSKVSTDMDVDVDAAVDVEPPGVNLPEVDVTTPTTRPVPLADLTPDPEPVGPILLCVELEVPLVVVEAGLCL